MVETRKSNRKCHTFIGLIAIAVVALLGLIYISSRNYEGVEFSPYSFQTRSFNYRLSIFSGFSQGTMIVEPSAAFCSTDVTKYLSNSTQSPVALSRWDLVNSGSLTIDGTFRGEASVLVEALQMFDSKANDTVWGKWSFDNPKLAAVLWPSIQELAIHNIYFVIPELLMQIPDLKTTERLDQEIAKFSVSGALIQSERLVAMNRSVEAKSVIEWGLSISQRRVLWESPEVRQLQQLLESVSNRVAAPN